MAEVRNVAAPYDRIVSLGRACQPAWQIRRCIGQRGTFPFDWVITPDASLRNLIATNLEGWFDRDKIKPLTGGGFEHATTGMRFIHEFTDPEDFTITYAEKAKRMEQLALRWFSLIGSGKDVLFIRQHERESDPMESAARLVEALVQHTSIGFEMLYLVDPAIYRPDWRVEGVTFRATHPKGPAGEWYGVNAEWEAHFAAMGIKISLTSDVPQAMADAAGEAVRQDASL